jgi:metal-responsive CopG/Arc/MetJ family transcriptional regulator
MPRSRRARAVGRPRKRIAGVGRIDVKLPRDLVDQIERLVAERIYLSKTDFVRSAVRENLGTNGTSCQPAVAGQK